MCYICHMNRISSSFLPVNWHNDEIASKNILFAVLTHYTSQEYSQPYSQNKLGRYFSFSRLHSQCHCSHPATAQGMLPRRLRSCGLRFPRTDSIVCASPCGNSGPSLCALKPSSYCCALSVWQLFSCIIYNKRLVCTGK